MVAHTYIFVYNCIVMSVLVLLIIVSILVAGVFLFAFLWSVKSGQMDDDYTPSIRILYDDELVSNEKKSK